MAETGGLENRIPGNRDEGSNPSPSANSNPFVKRGEVKCGNATLPKADVLGVELELCPGVFAGSFDFQAVGEGARLSVEPIADGSETKLTSIHCPGDELVSLAGSDL